MADRTAQEASLAGVAPTYNAAEAGGDSFANDGRTLIHVKNTNGATRDVTIASTAPLSTGLARANKTVTVPATTGDLFIGPFDPNRWNDANGKVQLTWTAATGVTFALIRTPVPA